MWNESFTVDNIQLTLGESLGVARRVDITIQRVCAFNEICYQNHSFTNHFIY